MRNRFEIPEIEIMLLGAQDDIITASGFENANGEENASGVNETPDW